MTGCPTHLTTCTVLLNIVLENTKAPAATKWLAVEGCFRCAHLDSFSILYRQRSERDSLKTLLLHLYVHHNLKWNR